MSKYLLILKKVKVFVAKIPANGFPGPSPQLLTTTKRKILSDVVGVISLCKQNIRIVQNKINLCYIDTDKDTDTNADTDENTDTGTYTDMDTDLRP